MDEAEQRYDEVERAEHEWREHCETGWAAWYGSDPDSAQGTATADALAPGWREREQELWAAFRDAREAWLLHLRR
jgi:hypothetical protein